METTSILTSTHAKIIGVGSLALVMVTLVAIGRAVGS